MKHFNLIKENVAVRKEQPESESIKKRLGISFALYIVFFVINAVTGLFMQTITLAEEFAPATAAAAMLGRDWSAVMPSFGSMGELVQGVLYLPAMLLFPDPILQYKFYMILSAAVYALTAPCAYIMASRLGVSKDWQKAITASVCTLCPVIVSGSHFLAAEPLTSVIIWLIALIVLRDKPAQAKKPGQQFMLANAAGILCAVAYFINKALIILPVIICGYCIYIHFMHKRQPLLLSAFIASFAVIFAVDILGTVLIESSGLMHFDGGLASDSVQAFGRLCSDTSEFFALLGGRIYCFVVSSWGMATGAIAFIVISAASYYNRKRKGNEQFYSENFVLFGLFFALSLLIFVSDAFFALAQDAGGQETYLSSAPSAAVITPLIFIFFAYIFIYGITYVRLMSVISVTGVIAFISITLCRESVLDFSGFCSVGAVGISPLTLRFSPDVPFDSNSMVYPVFFIFTAFAALIPIACCARKHVHSITAFTCAGLIAFSGIYTYFDTVLAHAAYGAVSSEAMLDMSSYAINKNTAQTPPVIAVNSDNDLLAMKLQFFNQNRAIVAVDDVNELPESCYLFTDNTEAPDDYCVLIGRTDNASIYVCGEKAVLYNEKPAAQSR